MSDLRVTFPEPCSENWDKMAPRGCNRFCKQCERTIIDLSALDIDQAENMLTHESRVCVRARVDGEGIVELKRKQGGSVRRMIFATGASLGMMMTGAHAAEKGKEPRGEIGGKLDTSWPYGMVVTAKGADGKEHRGKVKRDGGYKIKRLAPGTYSIEVSGGCGENWDAGTVVVRDRDVVRHDATDPNDCIIVGMIQLERNDG